MVLEWVQPYSQAFLHIIFSCSRVSNVDFTLVAGQFSTETSVYTNCFQLWCFFRWLSGVFLLPPFPAFPLFSGLYGSVLPTHLPTRKYTHPNITALTIQAGPGVSPAVPAVRVQTDKVQSESFPQLINTLLCVCGCVCVWFTCDLFAHTHTHTLKIITQCTARLRLPGIVVRKRMRPLFDYFEHRFDFLRWFFFRVLLNFTNFHRFPKNFLFSSPPRLHFLNLGCECLTFKRRSFLFPILRLAPKLSSKLSNFSIFSTPLRCAIQLFEDGCDHSTKVRSLEFFQDFRTHFFI